MPLKNDIKKVLVIGSGPIVIGQAAEFDYAGTQVCKTLTEIGLEVVLVNSNPATIMTDKTMASKVYIEPLKLDVLKKIIMLEKPDSLLPTLGGQTGLTLGMELAKEGFLERNNVKLIGATLDSIDKAEDRQMFEDMLADIGQPVIPSKVVNNLNDAIDFTYEIGFPVIIRPAYTLGGTGGGIAHGMDEFKVIAENGLRMSPITQIMVQKCISGWKEIEFEAIRDGKDNVITVCSMENIDPVGVHTGDSIVVAPAITLADKEFEMLRTAAINIVRALKVEGGCNIQFALHPDSFEYKVIEVNPRLSRSSALASKATGYPIAKVASLIAVGFTLDEIVNFITKKTYACTEPTIDYVVVKFPRWPFDKFVYGNRTLGTQMKATGEIMAIGNSFEMAMMKAVRCIELGLKTFNHQKYSLKTKDELYELVAHCDDERIFAIYAALKKGITPEEIYEITKIDKWFLYKMLNIVDMEKRLAESELDDELYMAAKHMGFLDGTIEELSGQRIKYKRYASYKMVDTCAAEVEAETPYFYSTFDEENEADIFLKKHPSDKKKVVVIGSGPIRIGQGVEFDYCSVHCVNALKKLGYEAVLINNNPETVSTDFDVATRLYFEPLTQEDVESVLMTEKPWGVVVQFGGQTAIKLTKFLSERGFKILGTPADSIDAAEDRERFDELLERCAIPRPAGHTAFTTEEALKAANSLGFPVLLRPSYVLGGQNMIIAYSDDDIMEYMDIITGTKLENPVLIDKYLMGTEIEVDAVCDGESLLIPGVMEHIERAGVHSGDSISVYPPQTLSDEVRGTVVEYTRKLAAALNVQGLVNVQYVLYEGQVYVIEVNPRSSRTIPYISKVTNIPIVELATRAMFGEKIADFGFGEGLYPDRDWIAVKVPVFSFPKLGDVDVHLGPEMKSTGEVLGLDRDFETALFKGLLAAGYELHKAATKVLITVKDVDKPEIVGLAQKFVEFGYEILATSSTAKYLTEHGVKAETVSMDTPEKFAEIVTIFDAGEIDFVVSTSKIGRKPAMLSVQLRRKAIERAIATLTSIDTANALANCLLTHKTVDDLNMIDICKL
ncbi:MAG: carbamoyl-phosphate synthase large subunit [Oscillospiraceae bacterium]|nr:carbamoyl-phosphate synthase large subunit [Oscillospiraceae bacterium]